MNQIINGYVVHVVESTPDVHEDYAEVFITKAAAMKFINEYADRAKATCYRLYVLGDEIPLKERKVEKARPVEYVRFFELATDPER